MKVSVIIPFLNAEKFIREAIESVFAQTCSNWELLLIDDGSTDRSTVIARSYAAAYPDRVRYLEHEAHQNLGKSSSRNLGIYNARGDYLAFLDSDDTFLPTKLERQVALLEATPGAGMVYGRTRYWYSWTGKPKDSRRDFMSRLGVKPDQLFSRPDLLTLFLKNSGTVPCLCALLARRQTVLDVGGFDETIQHLYEDQVLLAKICLDTPVYVESGCGELYRQHPDSSSAIAIQSGDYNPVLPNQARLSFLTWLSRHLTARGIQDAALQRALKKTLRPYNYPNIYRLINPLYYLLVKIRGRLNSVAKRIKLIFTSVNIRAENPR